ncbi:MAG: type II toxin-antitoxin system HicA family toxin [Chloroflexota bacterium]|nr:type II toxin-antitoxin system HicA family toxin [Chloroflexota bacterium]MDE2696159.1 type II toxin-antitoxin system HicA family toxin [Chloroflexota bacterium]MXZ46193.1 type II toxin-antitoxin system HicA family toxin [Chloroflexota bacterium]MYE31107.1 type II toxin-antitoxin system HicA family toxin [Chloroflexota bacterium]
MRYRELTRKLRALGCEFDRQSRGSHEIWRNPSNGARTTIPNWGGRDLRTGTVRGILRDLRLDRRVFDRA